MAIRQPDITTSLEGELRDAQYDFYGKTLALCDNSGKLQILSEDNPELDAVIPHAHYGIVAAVDWAYPEFGTLVVSAGREDQTIKFWKLINEKWEESFPDGIFDLGSKVKENLQAFPKDPKEGLHFGEDISCLKFAPKEYGCVLIVGTVSGRIFKLDFANGMFGFQEIFDFTEEILSISFGPVTHTETEIHEAESELGLPRLRFAVNVDKKSQIFECIEGRGEWSYITVGHHESQCNTVSWASNLGSGYDIIASGGNDTHVLLWERESQKGEWEKRSLIEFKFPVIRVNWNQTGPIVLQVTVENGSTLIYKERMLARGDWDLMSEVDPEGNFVKNKEKSVAK